METGADLAQFVHDLAGHVRTLYLMSMAGLDVELQISESMRTVMIEELKLFGQDRLSRMLVLLGDVSKELRVSSNPRLTFEIALTRMVRPESDLTLEALAERVEELERRLSALGNSSASVEASPVASARAGSSIPQYTAASAQPAVHAPSVSAPASGGSFDQPVSAAQSSQIPVAQVSLGQNAAGSQAPVSQPAAQLPPQASAPVAPSVPQALSPVVQSTPQASVPVVPAAQPAGSFSSVSEAAQPHQGTTLTAQVDLSNPAAVQRLWHSVTASLRKVNPARGVLFMNARFPPRQMARGLWSNSEKIALSHLTRLKKLKFKSCSPKPFKLLRAEMPYPSALATAIPSATPVAAQPASVQSGTAPQSNTVAQAAKNPYAAKAVAAVRAAQAAAKASQAKAPQPVTQNVAYAAPPLQQMGDSAASSPSPESQIQPMSRSSAAAQQVPAATSPVSADPEPYDDRVPLDVYGASVSAEYGEDPYAQQYGASSSQQFTAPASYAQPTVEPVSTSAGSSQAAAPTIVASSRTSGASNAAAPDSSVSGQNETERIKSILTQSFGEGIKFEELPE